MGYLRDWVKGVGVGVGSSIVRENWNFVACHCRGHYEGKISTRDWCGSEFGGEKGRSNGGWAAEHAKKGL